MCCVCVGEVEFSPLSGPERGCVAQGRRRFKALAAERNTHQAAAWAGGGKIGCVDDARRQDSAVVFVQVTGTWILHRALQAVGLCFRLCFRLAGGCFAGSRSAFLTLSSLVLPILRPAIVLQRSAPVIFLLSHPWYPLLYLGSFSLGLVFSTLLCRPHLPPRSLSFAFGSVPCHMLR